MGAAPIASDNAMDAHPVLAGRHELRPGHASSDLHRVTLDARLAPTGSLTRAADHAPRIVALRRPLSYARSTGGPHPTGTGPSPNDATPNGYQRHRFALGCLCHSLGCRRRAKSWAASAWNWPEICRRKRRRDNEPSGEVRRATLSESGERGSAPRGSVPPLQPRGSSSLGRESSSCPRRTGGDARRRVCS
jgi:hypothetical protein